MPARKYPQGTEKSAEYKAWIGMITRCENKNVAYARWHGRGIKVCARWRNDFVAFLKDMGPRPSPEHSIDRYPNNDGDYEPGNCRWATMKEQANNRNNNIPKEKVLELLRTGMKLWQISLLTGVSVPALSTINAREVGRRVPRITDDQKQGVADMYKQGHRQIDIAKTFAISQPMISVIIRKAGLRRYARRTRPSENE